jgi:elongation factor 1-delta
MSLNCDVSSAKSDESLSGRLSTLEIENKQLRQISSELESVIKRLEGRISALEKSQSTAGSSVPSPVVSAAHHSNNVSASADDKDDDFELFGDENEVEDAEAERIKQERVKAYEDRKAKKPVLIAKSNIILDVKPWDDETDMAEMEKCVRSIEMDGLLWGSSKLVPLAYTIKKLQISCVVEDDKVSTEDLEEKIMAFEDYIQSIDIAAFNKI